MQMVWHVVYGDQLVLLSRDDTGNVFLLFIIMFRHNETLSALDGKNDMDVNLRIGVGHARKMPLLTELGNPFVFVLLQRCRP